MFPALSGSRPSLRLPHDEMIANDLDLIPPQKRVSPTGRISYTPNRALDIPIPKCFFDARVYLNAEGFPANGAAGEGSSSSEHSDLPYTNYHARFSHGMKENRRILQS